MKKVVPILAWFSVCIALCSINITAQNNPASLKDIEKVMFKIDWSGNVSPYDIGINADSLFKDFSLNLTEGSTIKELIDSRGISNNSQKIPLLLFQVEVRPFLEDYIFYFISLGLFENVQIERLENKSFSSLIFIRQNYDVYEKDDVSEHLGTALNDILWAFIDASNHDNGL